MQNFYKTLSVVLHPLVLPTIGTLLFFFITPLHLADNQKYAILGIIFASTYFLPLLILVSLKTIGSIDNFKISSIKERKLPILAMIGIFYGLGSIFIKITFLESLGVLFFGTFFSLIILYILFFFNLKTSLHLLSMGNALGFILLLNYQYAVSTIIYAMFILTLSGLLASARLHLKAHTTKEVYLGFFIGFFGQVFTYHFL